MSRAGIKPGHHLPAFSWIITTTGKNMESSIWDRPATDAQLESFYGTPPTPYEIAEVIRRYAQAYDWSDLADTCVDHEQAILTALADGNAQALFDIFHAEQVKTIKRLVDRELFGEKIDVDKLRKAGM
jgi:hypothetical protein